MRNYQKIKKELRKTETSVYVQHRCNDSFTAFISVLNLPTRGLWIWGSDEKAGSDYFIPFLIIQRKKLTKLRENHFYTVMYEKRKGCLQNHTTKPLEDLAALFTEATHHHLTSVAVKCSGIGVEERKELSCALFFCCAH